jgi:hypothetical protein
LRNEVSQVFLWKPNFVEWHNCDNKKKVLGVAFSSFRRLLSFVERHKLAGFEDESQMKISKNLLENC